MKRVFGSILLVLAILCLSAAPTLAASRVVHDPAGDAPQADELDITSINLSNRPHKIVATVHYVRVVDAAMVLVIRTKDGRKAIMYTRFVKPGHSTKNLSVTKPDGDIVVAHCGGYSVDWDKQAKTTRFELADSCLARHSNTSSVRFSGFSEYADSGAFQDAAPQTAKGDSAFSAPVARN